MRIDKTSNITFTYNHPLKTAYKKGMMPTVKRGLYGEKIEKVSIEHLTPHSQGGKTEWGNIALTDAKENNLRGVRPISEVVNYQMWINYLKQFKSVKNRLVNGSKYIKILCRRFHINEKEI